MLSTTAKRKHAISRRQFARQGMILFIVLIIVTMLGLAGAAIVLNLSTENRAFVYESDRLQLEQVLLSAVEYLKAFCEKPPAEQLSLGGPDDNPTRFANVSVSWPSSGESIGTFSVMEPYGGSRPEQTGRRFGLESESAKLNLRTLLLWEATGQASAREALMQLPGMTEAVADAILDWVDADDNRRPFGSESDYYAGQRLPYRPRNDVPVALEELLLVRGVERHLLLGSEGRPGRATGFAGEWFTESTPGEVTWAKYLTFYSGERNITSDGRPRINLNDPDLSRLHERLAQEFPQQLADFVVFLRQFGPTSEAASSTEVDNQAAPGELTPDFSRQAAYTLRSVFDVLGTAVEVEAPGRDRVVVQSPLSADPETARELLPKWLDLTTTTAERAIYGRVDILRAPREVLLAIPGMDSGIADRIISIRGQDRSATGAHVSALARLYLEGALTAEQLRHLGPYVTTWSDVWTADIIVQGPGSSPLRLQARITIDATAIPARQIYWKHMGAVAAQE